ncbi:adenine phosphoribosyltransferase [Candidatus Micrarchaeota archaeon]|nr:adenine phosphoribosyltransferase [Candidatus Micrarchaeota archaeon]
MNDVELKERIRNIPDFPKKGIVFRDITTLLKDGKAFGGVVDMLAEHFKSKNIDVVVAAESRGFIFGAAIANALHIGFVPVRKPGKLPHKTIKETYELEYGSDSLEIHEDGIEKGSKVLIVDDLLATGGTTKAAVKLVERLGGKVAGIAFVIELSFLHGRDKLRDYDVFSLVKYDSE